MQNKRESFEYDLLERKHLAVNLINIINYKSDLKVLAINSSWGTGKTTFIKMWENMINYDKDSSGNFLYEKKFESMYFNAWENDYISEPLISLLSELNNQIKNKDGKVKTLLKEILEKANPYSKAIAEIMLKNLSRGFINSININDTNIEKTLEDASNKIGELAIKNFSYAKNSREALKESLESFQKNIDKKVIIFIDELDRCRPNFAIELLETIKHIFNLENYIFVISLDKEQLAYSIKTLYGQEMDATGYLRRFFDLEYVLPSYKTKEYIDEKNKFLLQNEKLEFLCNFIKEIFTVEDYSLRDIDKAYEYISLIIPSFHQKVLQCENESEKVVISFLYAFFINLKINNYDIYKLVKNFNYEPNENYIKNNIIKFNINYLDFKFNKWSDGSIKEIIINLIPLYLELLYKVKNIPKHLIDFSLEDSKKFIVGIKTISYEYDEKVELYSLIKKIDILASLEFADNFIIN